MPPLETTLLYRLQFLKISKLGQDISILILTEALKLLLFVSISTTPTPHPTNPKREHHSMVNLIQKIKYFIIWVKITLLYVPKCC